MGVVCKTLMGGYGRLDTQHGRSMMESGSANEEVVAASEETLGNVGCRWVGESGCWSVDNLTVTN